ncbi:ABC-2 type transport system ATP-binding protein [Enterococcus sp. PF1-24]|uniref:ABC transporter ATP-binding protein n=1 Tax=unclassified Enterococcus TaxID=2608891 RepID=UPI00247462AF|nr:MULTISPECIES: ABC transporter ATP-binding protein [unclassified Enterococcus]MDH6364971.1 ABC-2 type transport system ATP-binding protein [Enterococcus sp. PFB1-1]MDH6402072.1 ABC-2 type transport system ATP-binding protein [Enterococcus sp. PF1-24]
MDLVLEHVSKKFDEKTIIDDASFHFEKGKIYGLLGRNGAGKTTLFNCISKNLAIDSGEIALVSDSQKELNYADTEIGFVYTSPHVPMFMTAYEFVRFFIDVNKARILDEKTPEEYLSSVGIKQEDQHRLLKDFSHGMQNKVQMLVSLMVRPPVLLLDEPLTSFDVVAAHEMKELILGMKEYSVVIFSTHILQLAQDLCDEVVLLNKGKLQGVLADKIHDKNFEEEVVQLLTEKGD